MLELLTPIFTAYPGWSLFLGFLLMLSILEAIPATCRAIRGGPFVVNKTETKEEKKS